MFQFVLRVLFTISSSWKRTHFPKQNAHTNCVSIKTHRTWLTIKRASDVRVDNF